MTDGNGKSEGFDLAGLGKVAKAIPPEVYNRSAATALSTFEKLVAPITESTSGLGRYIRQRFDSLVDTEKAVAAYTLEKALRRAESRSAAQGKKIAPPSHPKSFVASIEEAAGETNPALHEMWANLLASQLTDDLPHPYFVGLLKQFSANEARVLHCLYPKLEIIMRISTTGYKSSTLSIPSYWIRYPGQNLRPWEPACSLLTNLGLAGVAGNFAVSPTEPDEQKRTKAFCVLYLSDVGELFLSAVSEGTPQRSPK